MRISSLVFSLMAMVTASPENISFDELVKPNSILNCKTQIVSFYFIFEIRTLLLEFLCLP